MLEFLHYIAKLYTGLFLITYLTVRVRFWRECKSFECFLRSFFQFILFLMVFLFFAVLLKALDIFSIISFFLFVLGLDYFLANRSSTSKFEIFKVKFNGKFYDLLDNIATGRVKLQVPKLDVRVFLFVFVFLSGLMFLMRDAFRVKSILTFDQHEILVKITSILMNKYNFELGDLGLSLFGAFFSLILGVNQHVVLHFFGAFNFLILVVSISLISYRLSSDFLTVVLNVCFFAFVFPMFDLILNPIEGNSFLFGLGWLLMVISFWNDVSYIQRVLSLLTAFLINLSTGLVTLTLVVSSWLFAKSFEVFKQRMYKSIILTLFAFLAFVIPLGIDIALDLGVAGKLFVKHLNIDLFHFDFWNILLFLAYFTLFVEIAFWFNSKVEFYKVFYTLIFFLSLTYMLLNKLKVFDFYLLEPIYPVVLIFSLIWLGYILGRVFGSRKFYHSIFVVSLMLLLVLNAFLKDGTKFDSGVEPDEFVEIIKRIQRESSPFSLAIVSHSGSIAMVENWGWFMDWDYFLKFYILIDDVEKIYDVVYVFVPKQGTLKKLYPSFRPSSENLETMLDSICVNYRYGISELYFDGRDVRVYKLIKTAKSD